MDVRCYFLVTICVVLQVTWSARGLKLPLCNVTSKSVPFKAPPKSSAIQNATPFQVSPPCPKCPPITSSVQPNPQPQAKTSPERPSISLKKPSNTDVTKSPSALELALTQSLFRNFPNNFEKFRFIPLSNAQSVSSTNVVSPIASIDGLPSSKTEAAAVKNSFSYSPNTNGVLSSSLVNSLKSPVTQTKSTFESNFASQNTVYENPSAKIGNVLNLSPPNDQASVLRSEAPEFVGPQNLILNNAANTSPKAFNPNKLGSLSENNIASMKFTNALSDTKRTNSRQYSPVAAINKQGNILDKSSIQSLSINTDLNSSLKKVTNDDILTKLPGLQSGYSKSPHVMSTVPLISNIRSLNTGSTSSVTATKDNIQSNFSLLESKVSSTKSESSSINSLPLSIYEIPNENLKVNISKIPNNSYPGKQKVTSDTMNKILKPNKNIINEIPITKSNPINAFIKENPIKNTMIQNSAADLLLNIKESSYSNIGSNNFDEITVSDNELQQKSLSRPKKPTSLQLNFDSQFPNTILAPNQVNTANLNNVNNFSPFDINNIDTDLWTAILNQLRNPVTIKNNENTIPKTNITPNNNLKPVEPLPVLNDFQIIDFPNLILPTITSNPFLSPNSIALSQINNNFKKTTPQLYPSDLFDDNQNTPQKILPVSKSIPFIETNGIEIAQKLPSIRTENNVQNRLTALSLNTDSNMNSFNNFNLNNIGSLPLSISTIPKVTPVFPTPLSTNLLDITQPLVNNLPNQTTPPSLVSLNVNKNLQNYTPLKSAKSLSTDNNSVNNQFNSFIFPSAAPSADFWTAKSSKPDLMPTIELLPSTNLKQNKPFNFLKNKNTLPKVSVTSNSVFSTSANNDLLFDIDKVIDSKVNSESVSSEVFQITPTFNSSRDSNRVENVKISSPKPSLNLSNNVAFKPPKLVSTSKPELQPFSTLSLTNLNPSSSANNILSRNNVLKQNSLSITKPSSSDLISPSVSFINNIVQNSPMANSEVVSEMSKENFADFMQNSNVVRENVLVKSDGSEKFQAMPYSFPCLANLPNVNAPKYVIPPTVTNYAKISPRVPQIGDLVSTSDITKSLNAMAAEVIGRYFSAVGQKLNANPIAVPPPVSNSILPKIESVSKSLSEILNTPSATSVPQYVLSTFSPNPYTSNSIVSSTPISSTYLNDNVSLDPKISSSVLSQAPVSSQEIEKPTSNTLLPYLSSLTINVIPEEVPPEIVIPTYFPVDYQFPPSPIYPVVPTYPTPPVFPALPQIIEATVLRTGCKESQDLKKILEILVLNELINNNNECNDWGKIETIIALLCAT